MLIMYKTWVGSSRQSYMFYLEFHIQNWNANHFLGIKVFVACLFKCNLTDCEPQLSAQMCPILHITNLIEALNSFNDVKNSCFATNFCGLDPLWPIQYGGTMKVSIWAYQILPNTWACTGCCYKHSQASLMETTRNVKLYVSYTFFFEACWSGKKFKHTLVLRSKCSRGVTLVTDSVLTFGLWHASSSILLWFTTFEPSVKSPHR
jgi:hypothetical protein